MLPKWLWGGWAHAIYISCSEQWSSLGIYHRTGGLRGLLLGKLWQSAVIRYLWLSACVWRWSLVTVNAEWQAVWSVRPSAYTRLLTGQWSGCRYSGMRGTGKTKCSCYRQNIRTWLSSILPPGMQLKKYTVSWTTQSAWSGAHWCPLVRAKTEPLSSAKPRLTEPLQGPGG
jgi:hypothetical protein